MENEQMENYDKPSVGLNILSFIFPIVGWILYFVYRDDRPNRASACSKWAWISVGISVGIRIISALVQFMQ